MKDYYTRATDGEKACNTCALQQSKLCRSCCIGQRELLSCLQPDILGTIYLAEASTYPYGTSYATVITAIAAAHGTNSLAVQRAIRYSLHKAQIGLYPREAIAYMQRTHHSPNAAP